MEETLGVRITRHAKPLGNLLIPTASGRKHARQACGEMSGFMQVCEKS